MRYLYFMVFIFILISHSSIIPGLSVNNILEFQSGKLPDKDTSNLNSLYEQLNLSYSYKYLKTYARFESFNVRYKERSYQEISQYGIRLKRNGLVLKAGHFYEMPGNGLLLRAYEIPGNIYEDIAYRVRGGFYRDIKGLLLSYGNKHLDLTVLRGKPLINQLPATIPDKERRTDIIDMLEASTRFWNHELGFVLLRNDSDFSKDEYFSVLLKSQLPYQLDFQAELAREPDSENNTVADYFSLNHSLGNFGLSLEYKNYQNFYLGTGYNDPPTLVREHSSRVLNRSTHVTQLSNESGFQTELYYLFGNGGFLILNAARAKNKFFREFVFEEYFAEYTGTFRHNIYYKLFLDYAKDPFKSEPQRYAGGIYLEKNLSKGWSGTADFEYQFIERKIIEQQNIHNIIALFSLSNSPRFTGTIEWELTNDPLLTDNFKTDEKKHYLGFSLNLRLNKNHNVNLFAGRRRGGPACTSGICYEVLDFEGLEIRLKSKL